MTIHPYDFIFAGLALDIAGAVILAKGFMFKEAVAAFYESRTVFGGNSHLLKSALLQRAEAQVGAVFLILGFGLQIWGNLHGGIAASEPGWVNSIPRMFVLMATAGLFAAGCLRLTAWHARVAFYRIFFRNYRGDKLSVPDGDPTWLDRNAVLLDTRRKRNESDSSLLSRIEARRTELGAKHSGQASDVFSGE